MIEGLEKLLASGKDNALLRFGLGKAYLDAQNFPVAAEHLTRCVGFDPAYTAAWKLLGKARQGAGDVDGAREAWTRGIAAAQAHGDRQAEKEMTVFLRRLG
ncbi:tetratricopeptide repeat protein [Pandoraea sp. CB10b_02]|uniref:tetratricopeptide repeat protein n=1 Tax=Pandoraea sp. CB10b_02 TaxID=2014535 RepID=UPI00257B29A7|nr:tetratricopeptide repeat protein [Pandoraea sp. CB10b_02]